MNKQFSRMSAILCSLLLAGSGVSFAQVDASVQRSIDALKDQVKVLESKINMLESGPAQTYVTPSGEEAGGLLTSMQNVQVGGYLDVQYNQNLTRGGNAIAGGNQGRIFDTDRESFTVNAAELNFTKEANPDGGAGFRIDIAMGEDAGVVNADGADSGGDFDSFDLQQAYIEYNQPLGIFGDSEILPDNINIKVGRFATLAGLEVIEGPDNWNISRSFAFGLTIPFIHTGVRTNFQLFDDFLDVYIGVVNGWDQPVDNNKDKVLETAIGYNITESLGLFHTIYWGNVNADAGGDTPAGGHRFLNTNVLTWDATEDLAFMLEVNIGNQRRASTVTAGTPEGVQWYSYAWYGRYQVSDAWALAYRGEFFHDGQGFRTGGAGTFTGAPNTLWEHTFTLERQVTDNMIARLEYRYDKANDITAFGQDSSQQTIGAQVLYLIG